VASLLLSLALGATSGPYSLFGVEYVHRLHSLPLLVFFMVIADQTDWEKRTSDLLLIIQVEALTPQALVSTDKLQLSRPQLGGTV